MTIAAMPVPMEEASRFGIVIADEDGRIQEFQEKPAEPKSNLASMGIYIFSWKVLKEALETLKDEPGCDFESISFHIVTIKARDCSHMNITVTGKMSEHWDLTGKPIWN